MISWRKQPPYGIGTYPPRAGGRAMYVYLQRGHLRKESINYIDAWAGCAFRLPAQARSARALSRLARAASSRLTAPARMAGVRSSGNKWRIYSCQ